MELSVLERHDLEIMVRKVIKEELKPILLRLNEVAPPQTELIKMTEACKLLRVSRVTMHKWKKQGKIPYHRISNRIFFKKNEIINALRKVN